MQPTPTRTSTCHMYTKPRFCCSSLFLFLLVLVSHLDFITPTQLDNFRVVLPSYDNHDKMEVGNADIHVRIGVQMEKCQCRRHPETPVVSRSDQLELTAWWEVPVHHYHRTHGRPTGLVRGVIRVSKHLKAVVAVIKGVSRTFAHAGIASKISSSRRVVNSNNHERRRPLFSEQTLGIFDRPNVSVRSGVKGNSNFRIVFNNSRSQSPVRVLPPVNAGRETMQDRRRGKQQGMV